jgi:hypothetical protein
VALLLLPLLFAVTVKSPQAPLRSGCADSDPAIAQLTAGTPVSIRFSVSDGSDCYKVTATVDGQNQTGYLSAAQLNGLETFNTQRRYAPSIDASAPIPSPADRSFSPIVDLLNSNQPAEALAQLDPLLRSNPHHPTLLMLAGFAAYRTDDVRHAVDYWKESLALHPDPRLESLLRKAERESAADNSNDKLYGLRVALRYEGAALPSEAARSLLAGLDQEFIRISTQLGCTTGERITAIVQSRDAYLKTTGAAEWSGGLYDGRIHVSMGSQTQRALSHEMVHACLANIGTFPAWLHEGLAQKLSGDTLSDSARRDLQSAIHAGAIPRLENISQSWPGMPPRLAYALALAAAEVLLSNYSLPNILHNPQLLTHVIPALNQSLGL